MSFDIKLKGDNRLFTWHINWGEKPNLGEFPHPVEIDYFWADGDELGYIMLRFRNLPITHGGICKWRGEMAQFIYDNL